MKDIRIQEISIENFKCHKALHIGFDKPVTSIYGDNATGKSSVYDAMTWLLFGKDSRGSADAETIKPLGADGNVLDHEAVTAVEAVFSVAEEMNRREVTLRRTMKEVWASKRGSSKLEYGGNISEYAVDGVPTKKNGFDGAVKGLFGETLYRVLTNVKYFPAEMKWQERRAVLFDLAGNLTDEQIMMQDERFWGLKEQGMALSELKQKLLAERKRLVGAKNDGPARMSECQKLIDQFRGQDFEKAKQEALALDQAAGALREELAALKASGGQQITNALRLKETELRALEARNEAYRAQQRGQDKAADAKHRKAAAEKALTYANAQMGNTDMALERTEKSLASYRAEWVEVNGESFSGGKCPTCGQSLPFEQLKAQTETFEARKKERLARIEGMANQAKTLCEGYRKDLERLEQEKAEAEREKAKAEAEIREAPAAAITDMPGYEEQRAVLDKDIWELEQAQTGAEQEDRAQRAALERQLEEITDKLKAAQQAAAGEGSLRYAEARLGQLRQEAQEAAARLEEVEGTLFLIEEFVRYKASFLETAVNAPFRLARFRLFRDQANGGIEERCDVVYDGVPYTGLNSAMQINVGIDIINALSGYYGVRVPLFIDNAESVTQLEDMDSQVIRLVVSENDKELRIV